MNSITIGILIGPEGLRKWQVECLQVIRELPNIEVCCLVQKRENQLDKQKLTNQKVSFLSRIKRSIVAPKEMHVEEPPEWLFEIPYHGVSVEKKGYKEFFPQEDIQWIQSKKPDLLLRFGFGILAGRILNITAHGVWSFHHGDLEKYRGRPPVFWEMLNQENRVGITLQRLEEKLDAGNIIEQGFVPVARGSFKKTLSLCYRQSVLLLKKALIALEHDNLCYDKPGNLGQVYKNPNIRQLMILVILLLKAKIAWFLEKAFWSYDWKVGLLNIKAITLEKENAIEPEWLRGPEKGFFADPSFSPLDDNFIFVEEWLQNEAKGKITKVNLDNNEFSVILKEDFHLSFPKVYNVDDSYWLVPEMKENNKQGGYRLEADNTVAEKNYKTIKGVSGVDPIFYKHNEKWWAFVSPADESSCYHLNLYHADSFWGPYTSHSLNPVVIDSYGGRMAGPIYEKKGIMYRFGQRFGKRYGEGIDIFEIEELSKQGYQEKRLGSIVYSGAKKGKGIHSIEFGDGISLVDGYTLKFSWRAGIDRILNYFRRYSNS
ncbi:formyltransferase family protein [Halalkalibaculum sp. DA384]|uniref:glucosamine inositolphosphorylceramide transferase family protein n=1 Tax=Halalkalibaculum sp. DA384 TaxID=3373606 RepID=UPI0037546E5C